MKQKNFNNNLLHENAKRDSSIELYRIIVMIFIIMHHYVVNSELLISNGRFTQIHCLGVQSFCCYLVHGGK